MKTLHERAALALAADEVPSPCISVCRMRARDGWCEGCWRTLDEVARWSQMSDAHKRAVWMELAQRAQGEQA